MGAKQAVGQRGEDVACAYLEERGYTVVERNWRCSAGELDVVALDVAAHALVFCEVKCRTGLGYGDPLEAITAAKVARLRELAGHWLRAHGGFAGRVRLDAVGVLLRRGYAPQVTHVRAVGS